MKKGLISIIIPTFNRKDLLGRCLDSVFSQDYENIEVIVVDNNSIDSTVQFVAKEYPSVKIVMNRENYGPSFSRNQSVFCSKGEYVLFLDSDTELINKGMISRMIEIMSKDETVGSLGGEAIVDEQKNIIGFVQFRSKGTDSIHQVQDSTSLIDCDYLPTSNCMVRKSLLYLVGGFDPYFFYQAEDLDLGFRLRKKGYRHLTSPQVVALHKYSAVSASDMNFTVFRGKMRFYLKNQGIRFLIVYPLMELRLFLLNGLNRQERTYAEDVFFDDTNRIPHTNRTRSMLQGFLRAYLWNLLYLPKTLSSRRANFLSPARMRQYITSVGRNTKSSGSLSTSAAEMLKRKAKQIIPYIPHLVTYPIVYGFTKARVLRAERFETPANLYLFVTDRCNARCRHCFYWRHLNSKEDSLDIGKIEKIVSSLRNNCNVVLTGGEPFLREDIHQICRVLYSSYKCESVTIPTNGFLPSLIYDRCRTILNECPELNSLTIVVSLDGLKETHEGIRGVPGGFEEALKTLRLLIDLEKEFANFHVKVTTTISDFNFKEIVELIGFVQPLQVQHDFNLVRTPSSHVFGVPRSLIKEDFDPKERVDKELSNEDLRDLFSRIKRLNTLSPYPFWDAELQLYMKYAMQIMEKKKKIFRCYAGMVSGVIFSNGDVGFCEMIKPFANLRDTDFDFYKLWNSESAEKIRQKIQNCACTHICNMTTNMSLDSRTLFEKLVLLPKEKFLI